MAKHAAVGLGGKPNARPLTALRRSAFAALLAVIAVQTTAGCEANKNYEQRQAYANTLPTSDPPGCLGLCQPDPGSPLVDCEAAEQDLEFVPIWNFEHDRNSMAATPRARSLYTYDDDSIHNLTPQGWEPNAVEVFRCQGAPVQEWGFHITGGPFRDYGGGMGTRFDRLNTDVPGIPRTPDQGACNDAVADNDADYCPPAGTEYPFDRHTIDVREYEGISLWARRGPDSQPLLRVMVGDKHTDDDISFLMYEHDPSRPRYCERNLVCDCPRNVPCSEAVLPTGATIFACYDPLTEPEPADERSYQLCGDWVCSQPYSAFPNFQGTEPFETPAGGVRVDPQFYGRTCNTFPFRGGITRDYCFEPGEDPDPYENTDTCGDHWTYPIHLTTQWKFYKIPFTRLLQQGWAKEQPVFDLSAVSMFRFTWDKGYIDYWIDDVSLYRRKKPAASDGTAGASAE